MSKAPIVIYHANCWDGFCAAWIADKALGDIEYGRPEMFAAYYGQSAPEVAGRDVYILDFSYKRDEMRRILSQAHKVVVLDHHKTAQAELDGIVDEFIQRPDLIQNPPGSELPVIWFDMNKSGGRLTWEFFRKDAPAPWLVKYTEDRDLWRHALADTQEINAALRSYPLKFDLWDEFEKRGAGQYVLEGAAIRRAERAIVDTHVRNAREIDMDGHRVMSVNATVLFSEIAGELAKGKPFGACYFDRHDGKRQWSLRSDDNGVDVSAIAKAHGGGGHAHASGFEVTL
jgi:oligoribonuclease NrnB/cAMP/cGMP phosphodiesterase (DHH superfamily)